jgi:putative ABC transport system ATP-binding protein
MTAAPVAPIATEAVIQLDEVTKVYPMGGNPVHALAGVTHSFRRGSFWAIMGASGSGKSTMLNLLGCLDRPTTGRCLIDGQDIAHMSDDKLSDLRLRRLGFIFQSFNLIPQLTVQENIELPLYYLGWDPARSAERAAELAEMVGLGNRLDHRPTQLSGGQQQRVAIARALSNDPAILLADEPTGNLDSATGVQIMQLLQRLNAEGRTIIMVTHEPDIAAYARARLVMRDGRVETIDGDPG